MYARDVESALAVAAKNRYWRESDAEMVVSLWRDSGQAMGAFGHQWGINVARLRRWERRLSGRELATFHQVAVVPDGAMSALRGTAGDGSVEIVIGGRRVVARPGFDEATLVRVLRALERGTC